MEGKENWWPEYEAPVGRPSSAAIRTPTGAWYRHSTGGLAVVNPTNVSTTVPLAASYIDLYGVVVNVSTLVMPPMTGRVLLNHRVLS